MSEEKKVEEKKDAKPKKKAAPAEDFSAKAETKKAWSVEKCMKIARRFKDETSWREGAPSSYKSAMAHGWVAQCTSTMTGGKAPTRRTSKVA